MYSKGRCSRNSKISQLKIYGNFFKKYIRSSSKLTTLHRGRFRALSDIQDGAFREYSLCFSKVNYSTSQKHLDIPLQGRRHVWKSGGPKYLVTQEDSPWLGPTWQGKFWKNDPPDWLNRPFPEQIFINVTEW